jgi:hypothetical protein
MLIGWGCGVIKMTGVEMVLMDGVVMGGVTMEVDGIILVKRMGMGMGSCGQGGRPNSWDRREPFDWSPYEGFEVEPPEVNDNVKGAVGMGLILAGAAMAGVELGNPFDKPTKAVDLLKALPEGGHRLTKIGVGATLMKIGIDMVMDAWPGGIAGGAGVNPGVGDGLYGDDSIGP